MLVTASCAADSDLGGTDTPPGGDGGLVADGSTNTADQVSTLTLLGAVPTNGVSLVPGEVLTVKLVLSDVLGSPVQSARAEIALLGQSLNATASVLVSYSNEEGVVSFYVQAGSEPTSFQLRVTAGTQSAYVPITVVDADSAEVELAMSTPAEYTIASASVRAYANRSCATLTTTEPASTSATAEVSANTASAWPTLFESVTYAITVSAELSNGLRLSACVDGVSSTDATTAVELVP